MARRDERRKAKADKKATRRAYRADRRDQKSQRQSQRQESKGERRDSKQAGKTARTDLRTEARREKTRYKGESGFWSPEAVANRQPWDALGEFGSDVVAAFGGGSSEPETGIPWSGEPYTEPPLPGGADSPDDDDDEDVPITEKSWFFPAIGVGAVGVYLATRPKKKKRK